MIAFDAALLNDAILIYTNAQTTKSATLDQLIAFTGLGTPSNAANIPATPAIPDPALTAALTALVSTSTITFDGTTAMMVAPDVFVLTPTGDASVDQMLTELSAKLSSSGGTTDTLALFLAPLRTSGATAGGVRAGSLLLVNLAKLHAILHNGNTASYGLILRDATVAKTLASAL